MVKSSPQTSTWCVYWVIHVHTPYRYVLKLVIGDVPQHQTVTQEMVELAWGTPGEFGIPWANMRLERASHAPAPIRGCIKRGDYQEVPTISWDDILEATSDEDF